MTSVNLEKLVEYLKIQESWQSQNFTENYLCTTKYFDIFSPKHIPQAQNIIIKINQLKPYIIYVKSLSEEGILFNYNGKIVNANLKFFMKLPTYKAKSIYYKNQIYITDVKSL